MPYLPESIANNKKYTLVLDLDETLIHYIDPADGSGDGNAGRFLKRPGVMEFLETML